MTSATDRLLLKDEPSTTVERFGTESQASVHKTYRNRGLRLLQTFGRRSRAAREHANLVAVARIGVPCTSALSWSERRRFGFVPSSTLVTVFLPAARPLKQVLAELPPSAPARRVLVAALGRLVAALHRGGVLWGTAMPRNALVLGPESEGRLAVCDVPAAIVFGRSLHGGRLALGDLYDAAFSPSRRRELSRSERWRCLLAYCDADRRRARRLWRTLQRRLRPVQDLEQALAAIVFTYILPRRRSRPTQPSDTRT